MEATSIDARYRPEMTRSTEAASPLWRAHHWPEDYDRCLVVGGRRLCRRCAVLYPVAFVVCGVVLAGVGTSVLVGSWGWALVVLPLPAVAEFVLEHLGALHHSTRRLVVVTVLLGMGLGIGFARYLSDQTDPVFWMVAVVYGAVCLAAALSGRRRVSAGR
jgi:hypothetical protein